MKLQVTIFFAKSYLFICYSVHALCQLIWNSSMQLFCNIWTYHDNLFFYTGCLFDIATAHFNKWIYWLKNIEIKQAHIEVDTHIIWYTGCLLIMLFFVKESYKQHHTTITHTNSQTHTRRLARSLDCHIIK